MNEPKERRTNAITKRQIVKTTMNYDGMNWLVVADWIIIRAEKIANFQEKFDQNPTNINYFELKIVS